MTLTNIRFPEENPFSRIKVRHIFGWWFLLIIGIYFQIAMIGYTQVIQFDIDEPLFNQIFETYLSILLLGLVWRQCRLAGIEIKHLVGEIPDRYQWLPLLAFAIAYLFFFNRCILHLLLSFVFYCTFLC